MAGFYIKYDEHLSPSSGKSQRKLSDEEVLLTNELLNYARTTKSLPSATDAILISAFIKDSDPQDIEYVTEKSRLWFLTRSRTVRIKFKIHYLLNSIIHLTGDTVIKVKPLHGK